MHEIPDSQNNRVVMLKGLESKAHFCAQAGKLPYFCSLENCFPQICFNFEKFAKDFHQFEKVLTKK